MTSSLGAGLGDMLEDRVEDVGEWADPHCVDHGADPNGAADVHPATNPVDHETSGEKSEAGRRTLNCPRLLVGPVTTQMKRV